MVSADQVKTVQSTWSAAKSKSSVEAIGLDVFKRLFAAHPDMHDAFPFTKGFGSYDELAGTPRMKKHACGVLGAVDAAVAGLGDLGAVQAKLVSLGGEHKAQTAARPVIPTQQHFGYVGDALMGTLEGTLGGQWNAQAKDAWSAVYGVITASMLKGMGK